MNKKSLKESIQKSVRENLLKEKITDIPAQAISGIANMGRNIAGQYSLGGIETRLNRTGKRIENDWNDAANYISAKANKLAQSKNPMIAQQAQANLQKVDAIDRQLDQALAILKAPAGQQPQNQQNSDDPFYKHESQKEFEDWMKNSGVALSELSKNDRGRYLKKWQEMKFLGLDPRNIPMQNIQREIAIAAHRRNLSMRDLHNELEKKHGVGLGPEFGIDPEEEEEDVSDQVPPPPPVAKAKTNPNLAQQKAPQAAPKQDLMAALMQKQQQNKNVATAPKPPPPPPSQNRPLPPPGAPTKPSYEDATIPSLDKKNASQGNVGPTKGIPGPLPGPAPQPNMQSPARNKGKVSPPPARPPSNEEFLPQNQPEPIPLTRMKKQQMEMPPREETPVVPASIKDHLPPIKDDGHQIQVGSEQNPAIKPREDVLKSRKPQGKLEKMKAQAEKSKNPKDIEKYKKELEKDTVSQKKTKSKKST